MINIWEFILQTVSVSLVAGLLLVTKTIFKDKLTPRWQYGIWLILALRIIIPVRADRFVLLPFGLYLEMAKNCIETRLESSFSSVFTATEPQTVFPHIISEPQSITDILFVVYVIGVIAFLCFYFLSYIKLRLILKKGNKISLEDKAELQDIFSENKIKNIKIVSVEGINSAFICGVFSPVLVLPSTRETDKKVILHEIIHLKRLDSLQNIFWCILRCLHWSNPFMHCVFNIIGNDMEMLCDYRVLEKLAGEERREYGMLLLNEVNKKYARMPGTTSVSNGGRNIARRIEAIVRFKKYPKGMALVSVCVAIILSFICLLASSAGYTVADAEYFPGSDYEFQKSLAYVKINKCTTVAGAIDTYTKAIMDNNALMLMSASPAQKQSEIFDSIQDFYKINENHKIIIPASGRPFSVFNLTKTAKDKYSAVIIFSIYEEERTVEEMNDKNHVIGDTLFIPIEVFKENGNWVVRETGVRTKSKNHLDASVLEQVHSLKNDCPLLYKTVVDGDNGSLTLEIATVFQTDYRVISSENNNFFTDGIGYDDSVHLDADFSGCFIEVKYSYSYSGDDYQQVEHVAMEYTSDVNSEFAPEKFFSLNSSGGSSDGSGWNSYDVRENWDKTVECYDLDSNIDWEELMEGYSATDKVAVYIDGNKVDEFILEVLINGS